MKFRGKLRLPQDLRRLVAAKNCIEPIDNMRMHILFHRVTQPMESGTRCIHRPLVGHQPAQNAPLLDLPPMSVAQRG